MGIPMIDALKLAPHFPEAQCAKLDDKDFFFPDSQVEWEERLPRLKTICSQCVHQAECLEFALDNREPDGFWAGTTPEQRKILTRNLVRKTRVNNRQEQIVDLLSQGLTRSQVAEQLGIEYKYVSKVIVRLQRKEQSKYESQ